MKILFLTTALLAITTAQAQSATPTANDAQYQQNIEQVFRGAEKGRRRGGRIARAIRLHAQTDQ